MKDFLRQIAQSWVALLSGIFSVIFWGVSAVIPSTTASWGFWLLGILACVFACYQPFRREKELRHQERAALELKIAGLESQIKALQDQVSGRLSRPQRLQDFLKRVDTLMDWTTSFPDDPLLLTIRADCKKWIADLKEFIRTEFPTELPAVLNTLGQYDDYGERHAYVNNMRMWFLQFRMMVDRLLGKYQP